MSRCVFVILFLAQPIWWRCFCFGCSIWTTCWRTTWSRWSRKRSCLLPRSTPSLAISRRLWLSSACSSRVWKKLLLSSPISTSSTSPISSRYVRLVQSISYRIIHLLLLPQNVLFAIGSAFLQHANHFKLYSSFCASHSKAQKVLLPSEFRSCCFRFPFMAF